ncbi:MAG: hypothetical protein KAR21_00045 [Spirochaetales bacterium]|nr:hypothetical protein [Spirochaetales bacterium]
MSRYIYAEYTNDEVKLYNIDRSRLVDNNSNFDAVIMSRLDYDIQVIEFPPVSENEIEKLLSFRIRSLYPGKPEETVFDYRIEKRDKKNTAVLFISEKKIIDKYKEYSNNKPLFLPAGLIVQYVEKRKNQVIIFLHAVWIELLYYKQGVLLFSRVIERKNSIIEDIKKIEKDIPETLRQVPALFITGGLDKKGLDRIIAGNNTIWEKTSVLSLMDILNKPVSVKTALFRVKKKYRFFNHNIGICIMVVILISLSLMVFNKHVEKKEKYVSELKAFAVTLETDNRAAITLQEEIKKLEEEYSGLYNAKPPDLYKLLSELTFVLGKDVSITNLTIKDNSFRIEAVGKNTFNLLDRFKGRNVFKDVRMYQVFPIPDTDKERFSISGLFYVK